MNHNRIATFILILGGLLTLTTACSQEEPASKPKGQAANVKMEEASLTVLPDTYRFSGTVEGDRKINLSTKLMGHITMLDVEEGDRVEKGQVLVRIQSENLKAQQNQVEANLAEAQAALSNAETNFHRIEALYQDSSATQKEYDDMKTHYEVAKARVSALKSKQQEIEDMLDYAAIESPVVGYVVQKRAEEGDMAAPGQPLLTVESLDDMQVRTTVPESQIDMFRTGNKVQVEIPASESNTLEGTVISVNPAGSAMSRQYTVKVSLKTSADSEVKSGMFARVLLEKGETKVLTVPKSAIITRGQLKGVYTINSQNELMLRWIRTGRPIGDRVEVLSGLEQGERYVSSFEGRVEEGQPIAIQ